MSYAKLIHDFLDEGLNGPEEDSLFAELNRNAELRNEFNQQVKMHVLTQNDMAGIAPPLATTAAIFSALGFGAPVEVPVNPMPVVVTNPRLKSAFGRNITTIIAILLSAAITAFIVMMLNNRAETTDYAIKSTGGLPVLKLSSNVTDNTLQKGQYPVMSSVETQPSRQSTLPVRNYRRAVLVNDTDKELPSSPVEKVVANIDTYMSLTPVEVGTPDLTDKNNIEGGNNASALAEPDNGDYLKAMAETSEGLADITRYEAHGRAASLFNTGSGNETPAGLKKSSSLENYSAGLFYSIDRNFSVGVEFGTETYILKYPYMENGVSYTWTQNPSMYWYGASLRYALPDLLVKDVVYPYAQLTAGGTELGFLAKTQAGLTVFLWQGIGVNIGYEYGATLYSVQGNLHPSEKSGLTIGVSYRVK